MTLKQIYISIATVIGILILGLVGFTSWYTVDESDQAVILTFGKAEEGITEPGLHFKMPWPIQEVETLSKETFSLDFGFNEEEGQNADIVRMITGDENIVQADLVVQWRITEPTKYLYNSTDPRQILSNATSASLRSIIGSSTIDEALTSGKAEIENEVLDLLITLMDDYDIGISISDVKLQEVDLPNEEVRQAFTKVTDARETMNTKINEARKYENQQVEEALGEKDAIITRAEGDKIERIEKARGDVAGFNALYQAYNNSPEITRQRLILETLDQVLPNANIYIMNDDGNTLKYLPLTPNNNGGSNQSIVPPPAPNTNDSTNENTNDNTTEKEKLMTDDNVFEMNKKSPQDIKRYVKVGITLLAVLALIIVFVSSIFVVKEGEYKVVRQFGEVIRIESEPGIKFRVPILHAVTTLPNKKMVYDVTEREINTLDKKRMIIDNYAVWEITDPEKMISTARTEINAESRMGEFIFSTIRAELGTMNYDEIINDEGSTRGSLNERVTEQVNDLLDRDEYGIRVDDVRIKRTDLPDENEQSVFNRMISERESTAQEYLSQGEAEKNRIMAKADRDVQEMLSVANAEAAEIRAEGEEEAAAMYNEAFSQDEEFYQLYRTLESYKTTINGETTIIIPSNSPYAEVLSGYIE